MADWNIRAQAFNAALPALEDSGRWLPLSVREKVADAILDALEAAGYTVVPTAGYDLPAGNPVARTAPEWEK